MAIFSKLVITAVILVSGLLFVAAALTHNDPLVLPESGQVAQDRDLSSDYVDDYVDVDIDPTRATVERQLINPFFMELGFFEDITSIGGSEKWFDVS